MIPVFKPNYDQREIDAVQVAALHRCGDPLDGHQQISDRFPIQPVRDHVGRDQRHIDALDLLLV